MVEEMSDDLKIAPELRSAVRTNDDTPVPVLDKAEEPAKVNLLVALLKALKVKESEGL